MEKILRLENSQKQKIEIKLGEFHYQNFLLPIGAIINYEKFDKNYKKNNDNSRKYQIIGYELSLKDDYNNLREVIYVDVKEVK